MLTSGLNTHHLISGALSLSCRKADWMRLPEIVRQFDISASTTSIGSALGGLIYIVVPQLQNLGRQDINVSGEAAAAGCSRLDGRWTMRELWGSCKVNCQEKSRHNLHAEVTS